MENKIKFRNHISVILENSLKVIFTIVAVFLLNFLSDIEESGMQSGDILWMLLIFAAILALLLGYQVLIWAKTYITLDENTLVIERNTLNKKKNTIGLKNVSNVNLEQNLLEMLLGTCKVKLDTNSLSTADQTDVNIVLKKSDAEKFRALVLARAEGMEMAEAIQHATKSEETTAGETPHDAGNTLKGDLGDIILHGLFSIRIYAIVISIAFLVFEIALVSGLFQALAAGEPVDFAEIMSLVFSGFWLAAISLTGIVREFVKYLNFSIERKKDKVYLNYGLFKKVAYSVPVDKINGIKLTQTLIARMAKRYMVEIINVGMDDDDNEVNTFFLPYAKIDKIKDQLHLLLPEFDEALEIKEEKQPAVVWLFSIPWWILYVVIAAVTYVMVGNYAEDPELKNAVIFAAIVIAAWRLICKLAGFFTKAIKVDEKFLKIVDGGFAKRTLFVKYDKIQYVTGKQCVIAKQFGIQKGTISLLASLKNRIHELPYFKENDMEQLKSKLI